MKKAISRANYTIRSEVLPVALFGGLIFVNLVDVKSVIEVHNTSLMDVVGILVGAISIAKIRRSYAILPALAASFLLIKTWGFFTFFDFSTSPFSQGEFINFVLANKVFFYLFLFTLAASRRVYHSIDLTLLTYFFAVAVFIKYTLELGLGLANRPTLLIENNYELVGLLILLVVEVYKRQAMGKKNPWLLIAIIIFATIISGSRSANLATVFALMPLLIRGVSIRSFLGLVVISLTTIFVAGVIASRTEDLSSIDRFRMLMLFISEIENQNIVSLLFGHIGLTPLQSYTCSELSFYKNLFSSSGDGRCYALIFHSMVMRVGFDHGLVGIFLIIILINESLKAASYPARIRVSLISAVFLSGVSVSSIGSSAISLPFLLALLSRRTEKTTSFFQNSSMKRQMSREGFALGHFQSS